MATFIVYCSSCVGYSVVSGSVSHVRSCPRLCTFRGFVPCLVCKARRLWGMHPDLSAHLHTDECNRLIEQLKQCHSQNPFKRYFGVCTDLDTAVYKCLMKEREANRRANAEKGQKKREEIRRRRAAIEEQEKKKDNN